MNDPDPKTALPQLLVVADRFTDPRMEVRILTAVQFGVRWIQLRDHGASTDSFEYSASTLVAKIRQINPNTMISINSKLTAARSLSTSFHTTQKGPTVNESLDFLGRKQIVGKSTHSVQEATDARRDEASYVTFGSVYETRSHPGGHVQGVEKLREVCQAAGSMPVIAIGGVRPEKVGECVEAGAHGIAAISAILHARDIAQAVRAYSSVIPGL